MTISVAERQHIYQAGCGWIENDDSGRPVICVTNTVRIRPPTAWLIGGSDDCQEKSFDCDVIFDLAVAFLWRDRPEIEAFERESKAFQRLLPSLGAKYGGRYVAIHGGAVVDSDSSRSGLLQRFFSNFGDVPVFIGYVGNEAPAYQLTPFRF